METLNHAQSINQFGFVTNNSNTKIYKVLQRIRVTATVLKLAVK